MNDRIDDTHKGNRHEHNCFPGKICRSINTFDCTFRADFKYKNKKAHKMTGVIKIV